MIVEHYLQLIRYYRSVIVAIVLTAGVLAWLVSVVLLTLSPVYTAAASVAVIPTEAEYSFGRDSGAGPRGTARSLTSTYIEYLKSRPVVEVAFDNIGPNTPQSGGASGTSWPVQRVNDVVSSLKKLYRVLDSGRYVSLSPRDAAIAKFTAAITLETVADSYILRVGVGLPDPKAAAASANALANAYVQRVTEQLESSVGEIGGFIREQIASRESEVAALRRSEDRLNTGVGSASLDEERNSVVRARELERQKLNDSQSQLDAAEAELSLLSRENPLMSGRSLADLSAARAAAEARRDAAKKSVELRQETARGLNTTLEALKQKEEPLLSVQRRLATVTDDLSQLHARMLSTDLTRSSSLTQVRIIDPAVAPAYPSSPRVVQNTILGLVAGLLVALMVVVVLDTASGTVKTSADLRRLGGARSLGSVPHDLLAPANDLTPLRRVRRLARLRAFGAEAERGLSKLDAFDAAAIQVSGLLDAQRLTDAAVVLASALAVRGCKVSCRISEGSVLANDLAGLAGDNLRLLTAKSDQPADRSIQIECRPPISPEWRLPSAFERSPALVFVVPSGEVQERDLTDFLEVAQRSGLSGFSLMLLEAS